MEKYPDAFRTISEVAEDLDLPQHVLRFWETRFSQIKPMKRGGGRRYYRPQDIDLISGIRHLLYDEGYTIKGVQKLLRDNGSQYVIALGAGDVAKAEAILAARSDQAAPSIAGTPEEKPAEEKSAADEMVGVAKARPGRRFLGLVRSEEEGEGGPTRPLSKEDRALLQETLFDLLECKRMLDQAR